MKFIQLINPKLLTPANSFLPHIAEHENFSANKYENVNNSWHFHIRENFMLGNMKMPAVAEKISCLAELNMKKFYNLRDWVVSCMHC